MLQLRATKTRVVVLLSILALLVVIAAILVLSHTTLHTSALSNGIFVGH